MNRKQQKAALIIIVALLLTWLFPHWIPRYKPRPPHVVGTIGDPALNYAIALSSTDDFYAFLFSASGIFWRVDWSRLILTDLVIITIGVSVVYVLRTKV